jgi:hypothetical protein
MSPYLSIGMPASGYSIFMKEYVNRMDLRVNISQQGIICVEVYAA